MCPTAAPSPTPPPLPKPFLARMATLLAGAFPAFLASYDQPATAGLRVNSLKLSPAQWAAISPFGQTSLPGLPEGFLLVEDETRPGKHPYFAAGLYYLQDPSAMMVTALLDPRPGEIILDLAAAPGGKATHIAARLQNQGLLVANEIHPQRVWALAQNLERWGATNVAITHETPERLAGRWPGFFDKVLVDAPCSGEGMFRKLPAARAEWSPEIAAGCALRQHAILQAAAPLVRPGGVLIYATCTFNPAENEGVLARFLAAVPGFALEAVEARPGFAPGRPDWVAPDAALPALSQAVRLWPHEGPGEGHFIACLRRQPGPPAPRPGAATRPFPRPAGTLWADFCRTSLTTPPDSGRVTQVGGYLYELPPDLPDWQGLRVIRPGRWLGELKKQRFEPAHALALSLTATQARRVLNFPAGEAAVRAYLRGEALPIPAGGDDGWTLVTVDGFPLGWGKRVDHLLKNHYPKGLRQP